MRSGISEVDITENSSLGFGERRWRLALTGLLAVYGIWCGLTPSRFHLPDALNLAIHETGHLVFGWGGEVLTALGGTLFQLILPLAFVVSFWRNQDRHAASVALWWVGQNFWNIARYVGDARAQELPLVGGGEHDWTFLLASWGKLDQDLTLARDARFVAWVIVLASVWLGVQTVGSGKWARSGAPDGRP